MERENIIVFLFLFFSPAKKTLICDAWQYMHISSAAFFIYWVYFTIYLETSNTEATNQAEISQKISNTEADRKKALLIKKSVYVQENVEVRIYTAT